MKSFEIIGVSSNNHHVDIEMSSGEKINIIPGNERITIRVLGASDRVLELEAIGDIEARLVLTPEAIVKARKKQQEQGVVYPREVNDMVARLWGHHSCPADYKAVAELTEQERAQVQMYLDDMIEELPHELRVKIHLS